LLDRYPATTIALTSCDCGRRGQLLAWALDGGSCRTRNSARCEAVHCAGFSPSIAGEPRHRLRQVRSALAIFSRHSNASSFTSADIDCTRVTIRIRVRRNPSDVLSIYHDSSKGYGAVAGGGRGALGGKTRNLPALLVNVHVCPLSDIDQLRDIRTRSCGGAACRLEVCRIDGH